MKALVSAHSGLRWIVLLALLFSIVVSLINRDSNEISKKQKLIYLAALISSHIQLLIGLILYFLSSKVVFSKETMGNTITRFFTVEHVLGMILAIALVTIGYSKSKKAKNHKKILLFYTLALVVIFLSIPWPFREALGVANWA